jgi:hypothetical protein
MKIPPKKTLEMAIKILTNCLQAAKDEKKRLKDQIGPMQYWFDGRISGLETALEFLKGDE